MIRGCKVSCYSVSNALGGLHLANIYVCIHEYNMHTLICIHMHTCGRGGPLVDASRVRIAL